MKTLGNDVYIQRGETWSLDFDVTNDAGDPYQLLNQWNNPYLTITVTAARYEQGGDFRKTYWLDLSEQMIEDANGQFTIEPMKRFEATEALPLSMFSIADVLAEYNGKITATGITTNPHDVTGYLFKVDELHDGNYKYKYVSEYTIGNVAALRPIAWYDGRNCQTGELSEYNGVIYYVLKPTNGKIPGDVANNDDDREPGQGITDDYFLECKNYSNVFGQYFVYEGSEDAINPGTFHIGEISGGRKVLQIYASGNRDTVVGALYYSMEDGQLTSETWKDYTFRVIKQFRTKDWVEQDYLFDMKIVAGERVDEYVYNYLSQDPTNNVPVLPWNDGMLQEQINNIYDDEIRAYVQEVYDAGMPLMPDYDTKAIILQPTKLAVSANIQGRY